MIDPNDRLLSVKQNLGIFFKKKDVLRPLQAAFDNASNEYQKALQVYQSKRSVPIDTLMELKDLHKAAFDAQQELLKAQQQISDAEADLRQHLSVAQEVRFVYQHYEYGPHGETLSDNVYEFWVQSDGDLDFKQL